MNWVLVITGAAVGAPLRYLTDLSVQKRHDTVFPWGTFAVNMAGCNGSCSGQRRAGFRDGQSSG